MNPNSCRPTTILWLVACLTAAHLLTASAATAEAGFLRLASRSDFLEGTFDGIAVDSLGALLLAERADRLGELTEPFVFALAEHPRGWVVGTGNSGQTILIRQDGQQETLLTAEEPEIFAVHVDPDGTVFAGSSPNGKVYRVGGAGGDAEVVFDPAESYIWDLARAANGDLLVATGGEGRLYAVDSAGDSKMLYDTGDTHLRRIATLANGDVLLGTAGEGLILRRAAAGDRVQTLYDSAHPEVVAFAEAPDGSVYAAVIASEASQIDLARAAPTAGGETSGEATAGVSVAEVATASFAGSRPTGFSGDRSVLLRLAPSGVAETVWRFSEETVYSLAWRDGKLWVGTGLEGKLFSFSGEQMTLEKDVDERQVVAVEAGAARTPGPAFATTNGAAIYRVSGEAERRGTYTSAALDAEQVATFGTLAWRGARPASASVRFSVRSGVSAEPDETWSNWSTPRSGDELEIGEVPSGRYVQWRAELESGNGTSPVVREVVVSYRQHNLAPQIASLRVSPPGEIKVPTNFSPGNQVFEPVTPDKSGIFTTLEPGNGSEQRGQKTLWKKGYRTISWEASDPNDDELVYSLEFRREGVARWLPLLDEIDESTLSFDASVLPDGEYRFRLRASDKTEDEARQPLVAERVSEPVINDHTPPTLTVSGRRADRIEAVLTDALSPLRRIELSIDAAEWRPVGPVDGLVDGRRERLSLSLPADASSALLRVMDSAFNSVTFDLLEASE